MSLSTDDFKLGYARHLCQNDNHAQYVLVGKNVIMCTLTACNPDGEKMAYKQEVARFLGKSYTSPPVPEEDGPPLLVGRAYRTGFTVAGGVNPLPVDAVAVEDDDDDVYEIDDYMEDDDDGYIEEDD